jgi:hypothetical protein
MGLFHGIVEFFRINILRELRRISGTLSDRGGVEVGRLRGDPRNAVRNMFLVSSLVGRMCGLVILNAFLETLTVLAVHSDKIFYEVREELLKDGIITIKGGKRTQQIELTPKGLLLASKLLTGRENENLEWRDLYELAKKHLWILQPLTVRLKADERDNLFRSLLILYSCSQGNGPDEFYRNLVSNIREDYHRYGSIDNLYRELVRRLMELYSGLRRIHRGRPREVREALTTPLQLITNFITVLHKHIDIICIKVSIAHMLSFRRRLLFIAYLSIASIKHASKLIQAITLISLISILTIFLNPAFFLAFYIIVVWPILAIFILSVVGSLLIFLVFLMEYRYQHRNTAR